MDTLGSRIVAAADALKPLRLTLVVDRGHFIITDTPDDLANTAVVLPTIESVEAFIADHTPPAAAKRGPSATAVWVDEVSDWASQRTLRVGDIVHYVSHGTPVRADGSQAYTSACRAAIVTMTYTGQPSAALCVLNPTGQFFNACVSFGPGTFSGPEREATPGASLPPVTCDDLTFEGGTWHWPGNQ